MKYIRFLDEVECCDAELAGGKGSNLAQLMQLPVPVPSGFCILTEAYRHYLDSSDVGEQLKKLIDHLNNAGQPDRSRVVRDILRLFDAFEMPSDTHHEIALAYAKLGEINRGAELRVAVRSSATTEDTAQASFAGQQETILNVNGVESLIRAVRTCWASLWNLRAVEYRSKQRIAHERTAIAVVVQQMVAAEVSGVMFTLNPQTGTQAEVVIEASYGLGESIVSGKVTPDRFSIDKRTKRVMEQRIGQKTTRLLARIDGGIQEDPVDAQLQSKLCLAEAQLAQLVDYGMVIESYFGTPQDIEWAISDSVVSILQSRPITALNVGPSSWQCSEAPDAYWSREFLFEWFQSPLSPLFSTLQLPLLLDSMFDLFNHRLGLYPRTPTWCMINGYLYLRADLRAGLRLLALPVVIARDWFRLDRIWREKSVPEHLKSIQSLQKRLPELKTKPELIEYVENVCKVNARYWSWHIYAGLFCYAAEMLFAKIHQALFPHEDELSYTSLVQGFQSKSLEADEALWRLVPQIEADPVLEQRFRSESVSLLEEAYRNGSLGTQFCTALGEYIRDYGHRVYDLDFVEPTAGRDPRPLVATLQGYVKYSLHNPAERHKAVVTKRVEYEAEVEKRLQRRPVRKAVYLLAMRSAQRFAQIRESRPFYLHLGWPLVQEAMSALGEMLAREGLDLQEDALYFMTSEELKEMSEVGPTKTRFSELLHQRRDQRLRQKSFTPPDSINATWISKLLPHGGAHGENTLVGFPGSPGQALGPARIVLDANQFDKLQLGDILVAPATTPAWTPLFSLASAIVTDRGGSLSHAAIVAREYQIPAVIGTREATRTIEDGQILVVNGSSGVVQS